MTSMALLIEVFDGEKLLGRQILDQQKIIVGRILSADFRVPDNRISRIHALIERMEDGSLRLTDLASTHGTFVNGERIVERLLKEGDEISFAGLTTRLVQVPMPAAVASPEAAARAPQAQAPAARPAEGRPSTILASPGAGPQPQPDPRQPREATVIRSLKETARTRGALEPSTVAEELEVTVYWQETILTIDHFPKRTNASILIGEGLGNRYIVPAAGIPDKYQFFRLNGQTVELFLHPAMKGSIRLQGKMQTLDELRAVGRSSVTLSGQDIAKIQVGTVNFFLMFVPEPPPVPKAPFFDQGPLFWSLGVGFSLAATALVTFALIFRVPVEGRVVEFPEKFRKILIQQYQKKAEVKPKEEKKPDPPKPKPEPAEPPQPQKATGQAPTNSETVADAVMQAQNAQRGGNEGEGARERGTEGKRGWQNAKNEKGITNRPKTKKERVPVRDAPVAGSNAALLSALKNSGLGSRLAKVSGASGGAQGNDPLKEAHLGVGGGGIQSGRGSGGSGLQGTGGGGGGQAVGVGGLGSTGFGGGAKGDGVGSIPGKGDAVVGTETGSITVIGGLSREEIERVVRAHMSEIRFCYDQELTKNPQLFGKVNMKWTIGEGGVVTSATAFENTTGSTALANCITARVRQWRFPSPPGGLSVDVTSWPFSFRPSGT